MVVVGPAGVVVVVVVQEEERQHLEMTNEKVLHCSHFLRCLMKCYKGGT